MCCSDKKKVGKLGGSLRVAATYLNLQKKCVVVKKKKGGKARRDSEGCGHGFEFT